MFIPREVEDSSLLRVKKILATALTSSLHVFQSSEGKRKTHAAREGAEKILLIDRVHSHELLPPYGEIKSREIELG